MRRKGGNTIFIKKIRREGVGFLGPTYRTNFFLRLPAFYVFQPPIPKTSKQTTPTHPYCRNYTPPLFRTHLENFISSPFPKITLKRGTNTPHPTYEIPWGRIFLLFFRVENPCLRRKQSSSSSSGFAPIEPAENSTNECRKDFPEFAFLFPARRCIYFFFPLIRETASTAPGAFLCLSSLDGTFPPTSYPQVFSISFPPFPPPQPPTPHLKHSLEGERRVGEKRGFLLSRASLFLSRKVGIGFAWGKGGVCF